MVATTTGRATDFITFSRTSNATVTGADGKIKWAGHNLLTHSESFDNAAWLASGTVIAAPTKVAANAVAAPNGTTTADEVSFPAVTGAGDVSILVQSFTNMPLVQHTAGIWVKAKAAGDIGKQIVLYSWTGVMAIKTHVTLDGTWQYVSASGTWTANNPNYAVGVIGSTYGGVNQGAVSVYLWGAHLYRSDLGSMVLNPARGDAYYPTTPRNLLGFTEDFSNAAWTKSGLAATPVLTNVLNGPNGLPTADKMVENSSASTHILFATVTVADGPKTFSVYAKAAERSWVFLRAGANIGAYFNLSAGSVGTADAGVTASIVSAGDGWYRCAITLNIAAGLTYPTIFISTGNGTTSYTGDGTSGIYLWGAQLSDSASLDAYSPVYGAAVTSAAYYAPRLDYDANGSALGLLVEEQRTNLLTYSNELNNAAWAPTSVTVTANALVSPDGTSSAETVAGTASTTSYLASPTATVATSTTYNISIYVKYQSSLLSRIRVYDSGLGTELAGVVFAWSAGVPSTNTTSGTWVTAPTYTSVGNGWYRLSGAFSSGAFTGLKVLFYPDQSALGTSTAVWGAQLEAGSFSTSLIPTGASTATRTADVASVSTQAFPYSSTAGSVVVAYDRVGIRQYSRLFNLGDATETNQVSVLNYNTSQENPYIVSSGSSTIVPGPALPAANTVAKMGFAFRSGDSAYSLNGAAAVANATTFTMAATSLAIGATQVSGQYINGHIRQITYIPRRLSNSELQARTV